VAVAAVASLLVYRHADRVGAKHATAWGIGTFLFAGLVVPVYFIRHWLRRR
jgi:hypothetical protein